MAVWKTGCDTSACVRVLDDEDLPLIYLGTTGDPEVIGVTREEWAAFRQAVKDGKFD